MVLAQVGLLGCKARDCLLSRVHWEAVVMVLQVLMEHFSQLHSGHGSEFSKTICLLALCFFGWSKTLRN